MDILNNPIVEVVLSMIATWALFAILSSFAHEIVAEVIAERGRFLKKKLYDQLADISNNINWAAPLYTHGAVDLLSRAENKPTSEIPSRMFAEVMVESLGASHLVQQHKVAPNASDKGKEAKARREMIAVYEGITYQSKTLKDFKFATMVLHHSDVMSMIKHSLHNAEVQALDKGGKGVEYEAAVYQALIKELSAWYDSLMGRITLWYKKKVRRRLFWTGLVIALMFQVDSIQLFQYYRSQPGARTEMINYFGKNIDALEEKYINDTTATADERKALASEFRAKMDSVSKAIELPVGWNKAGITDYGRQYWWGLILKVIGLLLTATAASYGAPFWFDLFRRLARPLKAN